MNRQLLLITLTGAAALACNLQAEEGGSGHYMPGATASFIDFLPGTPALGYVNQFLYYDGSTGAGKSLPVLGNVAVDLKATAYADSSVFVYEAPLQVLGVSYGAVALVPYVWQKVQVGGDLTTRGGRTIQRGTTSTVDGVGDIYFSPLMGVWTNGDLKVQGQMGVYAPSGSYDPNRLANVGKNIWTFEPAFGVSYLSSKIGLELSAFAGMDFTTKNDATDYQNGEVFYLDTTAAEHLPLLGGVAGLGANFFYYQQVTGDSGSGAKLGAFEGQDIGVGPVVSYTRKLGQKTQLVAEVKWLPELQVAHRTQGDIVWFKLALIF
jgi:hypothetical protein